MFCKNLIITSVILSLRRNICFAMSSTGTGNASVRAADLDQKYPVAAYGTEQIPPPMRNEQLAAELVRKELAGLYSVVYVTVPNEDMGKKIAKGLVEKKLAACVNIIPKITSFYEWKGEIQEDNELLLMIKTRTTRVQDVTKFVQENHSYEICEVISVPIEDGSSDYLKWLGRSVETRYASHADPKPSPKLKN